MAKLFGHNHKVLIENCVIATSFVGRFLGLMGRPSLAADHAIIFPKCNSIHTFFMRFPIDVVFVNATGTVVEIIEAMRPWKMLLPRWKAVHVIELRAQRAKEIGITVNSQLICKEAWG